jgi:hypothetical protein
MPLSCSACLTVASLVPSRHLTADGLAWCLFLTGLLGRTRACFTHAGIVFSGILLRTFTALMPLTTALASGHPLVRTISTPPLTRFTSMLGMGMCQ